MEKIEKIFTPTVRTYIYNLCLAIFILAGSYGYITEDKIPVIMAAVSAALGNSLAVAFRPTKTPKTTSTANISAPTLEE